MAQGKPCATHRMIMPRAKEDIPLLAQVWTMMSPFSPLLAAIIRSRAAFFLRHFGRMVGVQRGFRGHGFVLSGIRFGSHEHALRLDKLHAWANGGVALVPVLGQAKRECDRALAAKLGPEAQPPPRP
ncbi:hypothetical protein CQ14_37255 [Bradyrhizobium lablabi]|uniref:Uncharacterized protein n=1 Tax=Bradyrhizobium lablabi TaxID=722472 RepID=A0A0R3N6M1_9BRAD|nr:hypothetical protein CQ14_37255 [Bradyrhizobium lablabi]